VINRNTLRTALTAGLGNGFASMTGLADGQYVALSVLSVSSGTYGGAIELGRQRLLGTVLGSILLLIGYECLHPLPLAVGLAITLGSLRLLGGALGLKVGYKVGGMIVVMGWLVHEGNLAGWIPLRLFWTALGVLLALLSLRLFWPSRALATALGSYDQLLTQLQDSLSGLAAELDPQHPTAIGATPPALTPADLRALRLQLLSLRRQRPALAGELGSNPLRHPAYRLMLNLDEAASRLITSLAGMQRHRPPATMDAALVERLHRAEAQLLRQLVERLSIWRQRLQPTARSRRLPQPPQPPLEPPSTWLELASDLNDTEANAASLDRLERIAARLVLCRQALQAVSDGERQWAAIVTG